MSEEAQKKLVMTTTQVSVHRDGASPVFSGMSVRLNDEGGGPFLTLDDGEGNSLRIDFDEFDCVVKAVSMLRKQGAVNG